MKPTFGHNLPENLIPPSNRPDTQDMASHDIAETIEAVVVAIEMVKSPKYSSQCTFRDKVAPITRQREEIERTNNGFRPSR